MSRPAVFLSELFYSLKRCATLGTSVCGGFERIHAEGNEATTRHAAAEEVTGANSLS